MGRPRNDDLKEKIELVAWGLFRTHGYDATSYSLIAEECGISRNLAQYHFPRKEMLALAFMERILDESRTALGFSSEDLRNDFSNIYAVGTCFFEFLLQDEGYRQFLSDIIRNRDMTENILSFNEAWALAHIDAPKDEQMSDAVMRSVTVQMGGFYELLYLCLKKGYDFDPAEELRPVMAAFMKALGHSDAEIASSIDGHVPDADRVRKAVKSMSRAIPVK